MSPFHQLKKPLRFHIPFAYPSATVPFIFWSHNSLIISLLLHPFLINFPFSLKNIVYFERNEAIHDHFRKPAPLVLFHRFQSAVLDDLVQSDWISDSLSCGYTNKFTDLKKKSIYGIISAKYPHSSISQIRRARLGSWKFFSSSDNPSSCRDFTGAGATKRSMFLVRIQ